MHPGVIWIVCASFPLSLASMLVIGERDKLI